MKKNEKTNEQLSVEDRISMAKTINELVSKMIMEETGLMLSGFQYNLSGAIQFRFEVDCESSNQLETVYFIINEYAKKAQMKLEGATVEMIPDFYRAIITLTKTKSITPNF